MGWNGQKSTAIHLVRVPLLLILFYFGELCGDSYKGQHLKLHLRLTTQVGSGRPSGLRPNLPISTLCNTLEVFRGMWLRFVLISLMSPFGAISINFGQISTILVQDLSQVLDQGPGPDPGPSPNPGQGLGHGSGTCAALSWTRSWS